MNDTERQLATIQATLDLLVKKQTPKPSVGMTRAQRVRQKADDIHANTKRKPV